MLETNKNILKLFLALLTMATTTVWGQDAFHNFGNLRFHPTASVGFHLDLVDDGVFDNNQGLTGFYSPNILTVSGTSHPIFEDIEIVVDNGLLLNTWLGVTNNANFVVGDVFTTKDTSTNYLNFINTAFDTGAGETSHVNGYAAGSNKQTITFPIGDGQRLRYLTLTSTSPNTLTKCAYFFEDPNNPTSILQQFDTEEKEFDDLQISQVEFWRLESSRSSVVTLTWDTNSNTNLLAETTENLLVVGWNKTENRWEGLGNSAVNGNMQVGSITSDTFIPDDYEILTLGGGDLLEPFSVLELANYFLTPNDDGVNDFLLIDGIENFPNNLLNIYNRYGVLVYSKLNYANEFNGVSNRNMVISRDTGLSSGVYFYVLTVPELRQKFQGYLYISE